MTRVRLSAHRRNVTMNVDEQDLIGRVIARSGRFYEQDLLEDAYQKLGDYEGLVVDVGAHIGNHALWFSKICGRKVVALEPNRASIAQLWSHIRLNSADVDAYWTALGAEATLARLEPGPPGNSGMARAVPDPDGDIAVLTLDDVLDAVALDTGKSAPVALIKIDVEGSAVAVLRGAARTLERDRPLIYAEGERDELQELLGNEWKCFGKFGRTPTWGFRHGTQ